MAMRGVNVQVERHMKKFITNTVCVSLMIGITFYFNFSECSRDRPNCHNKGEKVDIRELEKYAFNKNSDNEKNCFSLPGQVQKVQEILL